MAIIQQNIWGHTPRPWGYEIRVDFTDDAGAIHNEVMTFPKEPGVAELDAKVLSVKGAVEERILLSAMPPPPTVEETLSAKVVELESRVAQITVEKAALVKQVTDLTAIKVVK